MMTQATKFTSDRARQAWLTREPGPSCRMDLTPGEMAYVQQVWDTMPGDTSWMDAFFRILNGSMTNGDQLAFRHGFVRAMKSARDISMDPASPERVALTAAVKRAHTDAYSAGYLAALDCWNGLDSPKAYAMGLPQAFDGYYGQPGFNFDDLPGLPLGENR